MKPSTDQQDRFYSSIAQYYSSIFPFQPAQLAFLEIEGGKPEKKQFLDIGCGSGELAWALSQKGAYVTAIDLNESLLGQAKAKRSHDLITYQNGNMLNIAEMFGYSSFDGVICFGNTLVHLKNTGQILDFFRAVKTVLKPGGKFFLQILHYDYIFSGNIETLPIIENELIRFERKYRFFPGSRKISFNTRLLIKSTGEIIENATDLFGIGTAGLTHLLQEAGFTEISLFSDFLKNPFGGKHLPLLCVCRKPV